MQQITSTDKCLLILKTLWRIPAAILATLPITSVAYAFWSGEYLYLLLAPVVPLLFIVLTSEINHVSTHFNQPFVQRYKLPKRLTWMETPDEYLPGGLYEPQSLKIYHALGWVACSIDWLLLRNVGGGIMWPRAIPLGAIYDKKIDHDNAMVLNAVKEQVKIDHGLQPVKWGIFKLHWELTKDCHGTKHSFKSEDWRKCGYAAKLEIGIW